MKDEPFTDILSADKIRLSNVQLLKWVFPKVKLYFSGKIMHRPDDQRLTNTFKKIFYLKNTDEILSLVEFNSSYNCERDKGR